MANCNLWAQYYYPATRLNRLCSIRFIDRRKLRAVEEEEQAMNVMKGTAQDATMFRNRTFFGDQVLLRNLSLE